MFEKGPEYWLTASGVLIYTAMRDAEKAPFLRRAAKAVSSAMIALGLAAGTGDWLGVDEKIAMAGLMVGSHLALDIVIAVLSDRKLWMDFVRGRLGGRDG